MEETLGRVQKQSYNINFNKRFIRKLGNIKRLWKIKHIHGQQEKTGNKTLYVDVKDGNGKVTRKSMSYTIKEEEKPKTVLFCSR